MSGSFIQELKRRNVFRVAVIYVVASWLLMQIGDVMFPALLLPEWTTTMLVTFLLLGAPIALILAWAYEVTPDGVVRTTEVPVGQSITANTGQKINYMIIGVLTLAVIFLLGKNWMTGDEAPLQPTSVLDKSIAVLPFKNQSASAENAEFFAAGVHDELLTLLSKLGDLKVISRTSVERLDSSLNIPEIGALLGVATVLEGQVQRAGDQLRINVQLIDTAEEGHLWANTYDRELTAKNIFDVQSDIARTIADALHAELSASDEAALSAIPTTNTEALQQYMMGHQHWNRSSWESLRAALDYFEDATRLDPDYAQAWAAIAAVASNLFRTGVMDLQQYKTLAGPAVERALSINNELAEAHAELADLAWQTGDIERAEASFKTALRLEPNQAWSLRSYGTYLRTTGRSDEAIPVLEKALQSDPLSPLTLFELGKAEMYVGHAEKNLMYAERILEIDPSSVYGYTGQLQAHTSMGRYDLAIPWFIKTLTLDPDDFESWAYFAYWYRMLGEPEWSARYMAGALERGPAEPTVLKIQVQSLMLQGKLREATVIARQALEAGLDDRWFSDRIFLRQVRDAAFQHGDLDDALEWYRDRHPKLFDRAPEFDVNNINASADLALLLRRAGDDDKAAALIAAAINWYETEMPQGVYGYVIGLAYVNLLALSGDRQAALTELRAAVDYGWRYAWPWYLASKNLDSIREAPEFQMIVAELVADMATQLEALRALPDMGEYDLRYKEAKH